MSTPRKTSAGQMAACLAAALFAGGAVRAQQSDGSPAPSINAPLEERIAAARSVKVLASVLGIELGSALDEAHEKLDKLCAPGTRPKEEGEEDEADKEHKPKIGEEHEEGHKVLWQLAGTDFSAVYITADDRERIDSITGFLRPGKQMPFDAVGEVAKAPLKDGDTVVWDVLRVGQPLFRVVAKGKDGKADSIRIFVVRRKTGEPVPYTGN